MRMLFVKLLGDVWVRADRVAAVYPHGSRRGWCHVQMGEGLDSRLDVPDTSDAVIQTITDAANSAIIGKPTGSEEGIPTP